MKKEDFEKLSQEEKENISLWLKETGKVETKPEEKPEVKDVKDDPKKELDVKDEGKSEKKVEGDDDETKVIEEKDDEKPENKKEEPKDNKTDEKFEAFMQQQAEAQANLIKQLEKLAEHNQDLAKEVKELKEKSPMANFQPKPSDNTISKEDEQRDDFINKYKNAYKN